jgi:replicative DNA helicase
MAAVLPGGRWPDRNDSRGDPRVDSLRLPPHSIDAEQAVLGGLMLAARAWDQVADRLREEDFYRHDHRLIFRGIGQLSEQNKPCDAVTLGEWFESQGLAEQVGGTGYVIELASTTPSAANIVAYADIVREKSILRQLIEVGTSIANDGFQPEGRPSREILESAEQQVFRIAEAGSRGRQGFVAMRSAVKDAFQQLQERFENKGSITGLPTGFLDFDEMTAGLQPSDLIILAARPSMGKCLSADAEIVQDDGSVTTIEAICRARHGSLRTLRDDLRIDRAAPSDFIDDGIKPTFEVTTRLGRRVTSTAPHPFLTLDGWKPLHALQEGDFIAVPRRLEVFGDSPMRDCEVRLLAYFIGDGGLTGSVPRFTATNPAIRDDFIAAVDSFGGVCAQLAESRAGFAPSWRIAADGAAIADQRRVFATGLQAAIAARRLSAAALAAAVDVSPSSVSQWQRGRSVPGAGVLQRLAEVLQVEQCMLLPEHAGSGRRNTPNPLTVWLREHGLMGQGAIGKHVPPAVFRLPREQLAVFVNRLFATDGWACVLKTGQAQIGYSSVSERLARQLQHLLLRFGVVAKLRQRWVRYRGGRRASWQLDITDADALVRFADGIGIHGKQAAVQAVVDAVAGRRRQSNVDHVPAAVWKLIAQAKGSMSWAELARRSGCNDSNSHVGQRALSRSRLARIAMVLQDRRLAELASSDVYWDRIESIVAVGEQQVFDLTVPDTHNFIANDICVHNTALAVNMAEYAALRTKKAVAIFSMEMSASQLAFRLISSLGRIHQQRLRTGQLEDEDWSRVSSAISLLAEAKIFIDDTPALSPTELRSRARRLAREHDLGLIVIDYLQLMQVPGNKENRATEISEISRGLKALAKELNVPVIALSQLNRSLEQRTDKRPVMADLRESGAIEQDADVIVFIYRDEYYNKDSADKGLAEIIIGKQRNGPTGSLKLAFHGHFTRFDNYTAESYGGSFE